MIYALHIWRKEKGINIIIYVILLSIYCGVQLFLVRYHEAWRDESQAWILARNSTWKEIIGLCSSEGHPCLWFFILKICITTGVSFYYLSLISLSIMTISAGLLLWKSPFRLLTKICLLLSPIFYYYNPVICRVYAVVVLLVILLCVFWTDRRNHPVAYGIIVALLFQSHILIAGFAIGCLIEMIICNKKRFENRQLIGMGIPCVSLLCMIMELRQTEQTETYIQITTESMLERLKNHTFYDFTSTVTDKFEYNGFPAGEVFLYFGLATIILFILCFFLNKMFWLSKTGSGIVFFFGIIYYWGIIFLVRGAEHIQIAIIPWIILFFFIWTILLPDDEHNKTPNSDNFNSEKQIEIHLTSPNLRKIFEILLIICCVIVIQKSAWIDPVEDVKGQFSGSLEIVKQAEKIVPENSVIAIKNNELSTSVVAYLYDLEKNFLIWDIDNGCEYCIHKWGKSNSRIITGESLYKYLSTDLNEFDNIFYVDSVKSFDKFNQLSDDFILIAKNSDRNKWNEYYRLYQVVNLK